MDNTTANKKKAIKLKPEEKLAIEIGIASEATGREYTLEESIEFARSRRKAWTQKKQDLTA